MESCCSQVQVSGWTVRERKRQTRQKELGYTQEDAWRGTKIRKEVQARPRLAELRTGCSSSARNPGPQRPGGGHHDSWPIAVFILQHGPTECPADLNIPRHPHTTPLFGGPGLAFFQKSGLDFDSQKRPVRGKGKIFSLSIQWLNPFQGQASYTSPPVLRQPVSATARGSF